MPKQGVDLVGAGRVGLQGAAILIRRGGAPLLPARCRGPILADLMRKRSRPSPALRTVVRAGAAGALVAAVAVPLLRRRLRIARSGHGRSLRERAAGGRRSAPALAQARRRPLRDADVGLHDGARAALRRSGAPAPAPAQPLPDHDRPHDRPRAACPTPGCSAPSPGSAGSTRSTAFSPGCTGSGSSSPTSPSSGSSSATPSAFPARLASSPPSSTSVASATSPCRRRHRGGPPSRA